MNGLNFETGKMAAAISVACAFPDTVTDSLGHSIGVIPEKGATASVAAVSGRARGFVPTMGQIDNYISIGRTA